TLEDELGVRFGHLYTMAQMPWAGVSLAPVLDDETGDGRDVVPDVVLEEGLLASAPEATGYLAIACKMKPTASELRQLREQCLLVALQPDHLALRGDATASA